MSIREHIDQRTRRPIERTPDTGFEAACRAAIERVREESEGGDIVALYPYDEDTDSFFAPVASGLSESDVIDSLPDLSDQVQRFRRDQAAGKIPDDLAPIHYGASAWMLAMRRPLTTNDATHDIATTFVRRYKIRAMVGLPLIIAGRVLGLLYIDYLERPHGQSLPDVTSADFLQRMERLAEEVAVSIDAGRHTEEVEILRALGEMVSDFSVMPAHLESPGAIARQIEEALYRVLAVTQLGAAAMYATEPGVNTLHFVAACGVSELAQNVAAITVEHIDGITQDRALLATLSRHDLHPVAAIGPRGGNQSGVLVLADRDPLALQRRLPVEAMLLQTAADLLGAMLGTEHLIDALGESNRTLGAVTRLSRRLLQPGATKEEALWTAVNALTDSTLPELNFEFANIFLLETMPDGDIGVVEATGTTSSNNVHAAHDDKGRRIPTWAQGGVRGLDPHDVVRYVATRQRTVIVAAADASYGDHFVGGYPEELLVRKRIPIIRSDGTTEDHVHAVRLREAADRSPLTGDTLEEERYQVSDDFTLNAELFDAYGHRSLVRVFVPFGSDGAGERASGVLEAGFHFSREQRLERVQIEALRACAATVAVAVETARMYEDATRRARQMEIITEISRAIAASIDLDQTLALIARNMARAVDTSVCLISLLDEDASAWYGAAASDLEEIWLKRRIERPTPSIIFDVVDRRRPMVVEDTNNNPLVSSHTARVLGIRSLVALPLIAGDAPLGAVILGQRDGQRLFTADEVERAQGLADQAAIAIHNARVHAREEEEHHIQKDVILVGFGQWGQRAYQHLVLLKNFFNFRAHVVEVEWPGRREALAELEAQVRANGDLFYWDAPDASAPAHDALAAELEPSCYVITYICTPAETHLPMLKAYYDLSNVVLIEKPLGAPPEEYRAFVDSSDGAVQIVAADHYWFKLEVRLLELLLTEERNLRAFLDDMQEVEIEIMEEQTPGGSGAQIGMIADLIPHAFAILSLLTPLERFKLTPDLPLQIGRYQPIASDRETYARLVGLFEHRGRQVRVTIDVGKGVANAKSIKLIGERRMGGRRPFYKFDFNRGEAIDGTQSALRAATRPIRQPGVPDNAHLTMLRHVIEKKNPAVGILSIREAIRANARIQTLERMAGEMLERGEWTSYEQGQRPAFTDVDASSPTPESVAADRSA